MKTLVLKNDDYLGYVEHLRHACRGIVVKEGMVLLSYEAKNNKYLIPGGGVENGETYEQCCERELLEETGMQVRAKKAYLDIEELFLDWRHVNHYFVCEQIRETGNIKLTEAETRAGCTFKWLPMEEALKIFGRYEDFHKTDIADFGLYRREYFALKEFCASQKIINNYEPYFDSFRAIHKNVFDALLKMPFVKKETQMFILQCNYKEYNDEDHDGNYSWFCFCFDDDGEKTFALGINKQRFLGHEAEIENVIEAIKSCWKKFCNASVVFKNQIENVAALDKTNNEMILSVHFWFDKALNDDGIEDTQYMKIIYTGKSINDFI